MKDNYSNKLEPCSRCCSGFVDFFDTEHAFVICHNCKNKETYDDWQLRGWRNLKINPPVFSGTIFVYGKSIGRTIALWNSENKSCDNTLATHWLRVPDPTKQININF